MSNVYEIKSFRGGISDYEDKGLTGAFKFGNNLDIRKAIDSLSAGQALIDIGDIAQSASASRSPSSSLSPSGSASRSVSSSYSPSASVSPSLSSPSASQSPSASRSPSGSTSPSGSLSPSHSVSPSPSPSAGLSSTFQDLILTFVPCTDGKIYGFGHTGKIYKINPDDFHCSQVYDARQPITGAAEWFNVGGQAWIYFATRTELHRKLIPGLSNWNDVNTVSGVIANDTWPKTNLSSQDYHTMREAGGSLIIGNGSKAALVGYDDSYTNDAVDLIPGNTIKTVIERNGRSIFGTYSTSNPNKGINAAIDSEVPLAQVGDNGEIFFANMTDSVPVKRFPGGGQVNPGGVANEVSQVNFFEWEQDALSWIDKQGVGNMALWGVYSADSGKGGIYSYGRRNKNHPFVMNMEYLLDVDEIGAIININGLTYASYHDGSDWGVKVTDESAKSQAVYEGLDFKAPVKNPMITTSWDIAELLMAPLPSGASVQFWYKINKTGAFLQAKTSDGATAYTTVNGKKAVFLIAAEGEIFEPRVVLVPTGNSTPEVFRARILFH